VSVVLLAKPSAAQQPPRDPVAAEALFQDARAAFKKGDYATACPKFAESNRLDPAPGSLFNLADCEEHAGHTASAWLRWQELATLLRPTPTDERFGIAQQHVNDLAPRLPRLRVRWSGPPVQGAVVKRDGVELGPASLDAALPIDPGNHTVEVTGPDRKAKTFQVTTREGAITDVDVTAGEPTGATTTTPPNVVTPPVTNRPPPLPIPTPTPDTEPEGSQQRSVALPVLGWISLGLGAVAGAVAIGTGVGAISAKGTVDKECTAQKLCSQAGLDAAASGHTLATASTATSVLGAVLGGVGITLLTISAATSSRSARVVPQLGPNVAGVSFEGRF
jgi:hypothetical protein